MRVVNASTGVERKGTTDSDGFYRIPFLLPAIYQVYIQAPGFSTASSPDISLDVGQVLAYNVQLKVGPVSQTIVVSGAQP